MAQKKEIPKKEITKKDDFFKDEKNSKQKQQSVDRVSENRAKLWSVGLFAFAVLMLLFAVVKGDRAGGAIHNFLRGIFGIAVFLMPVLISFTAVKVAQDKNADTVPRRLLGCVGLTLLVCGFTQIFAGGISQDISFGQKLKVLYENGQALKGGGFLSAPVALTLVGLFGRVYSIIIALVLILVFIMLIGNIGPMEFMRFVAKPFKAMGKATSKSIKKAREENARLAELEEKFEPAPEENFRESDHAPKKKTFLSGLIETFEDDDVGEESISELENENETSPFNLEETNANCSPPKRPSALSDSSDKADAEIEALIHKAMETGGKKKRMVSAEEVMDIQREISSRGGTVSDFSDYALPSLQMLKEGVNNSDDENSHAEMKQKADLLVETLKSFGVETRIVGIFRGPSVTRYEVQPAAGVKVSKITNLSDDIALNLSAAGVRIEAPIPGKPAVGIEIPNTIKDIVSLREILETEEFQTSKSKLAFAVGKDIAGNIIIGDVAKMPHVIIAGSTGSGKSVCTNSIIMSILYHSAPDEVRLVLVDPKIVEFKIYDGIPHLLIPVVTDPRKAAGALNWAVQEMERRYQLFADNNVRDLAGYNEKLREKNEWLIRQGRDDETAKPYPQIVIAIDEFADLMMTASKEVEEAICRIAQKARAAGMHLILATQRPTVNVITGLIKANIPSRIALSVMSQMDSRTILDTGGADKLLGNGDMLYLPNGKRDPVRVQGCFTSTAEIEKVVNFIKSQGEATYSEDIMSDIERSIPTTGGGGSSASNDDAYLDSDEDIIEKAIQVVVDAGQASTSNLQRKLKLGYGRAARIMDEMEEIGIIGPADGAKPRKVLITHQDLIQRKLNKN